MQLTKASNLRCFGISVTGFPQHLGCCCALSLPSLRYRASEGRFAADFSWLVASNRGFWTHGWATIGRFAWVLNSSNLAWWCSFLLWPSLWPGSKEKISTVHSAGDVDNWIAEAWVRSQDFETSESICLQTMSRWTCGWLYGFWRCEGASLPEYFPVFWQCLVICLVIILVVYHLGAFFCQLSFSIIFLVFCSRGSDRWWNIKVSTE